MKLTKQNTVEAILTEIIHRAVQRRIELGLTQQDVVDQTGISLRTLKQIEKGSDCRFSTLIRLLQAYDLTDRLNMLIPEPIVSPIQFIEQQRQSRKGARKRVSKAAKPVKKSWKWGDEQ